MTKCTSEQFLAPIVNTAMKNGSVQLAIDYQPMNNQFLQINSRCPVCWKFWTSCCSFFLVHKYVKNSVNSIFSPFWGAISQIHSVKQSSQASSAGFLLQEGNIFSLNAWDQPYLSKDFSSPLKGDNFSVFQLVQPEFSFQMKKPLKNKRQTFNIEISSIIPFLQKGDTRFDNRYKIRIWLTVELGHNRDGNFLLGTQEGA